MNPLGNFNGGNPPIIRQIADKINYAKSFSSPEAFLRELERSNPQFARQLHELAATLKNPQQAAIQALSQNGITPQQLMSMLQNR